MDSSGSVATSKARRGVRWRIAHLKGQPTRQAWLIIRASIDMPASNSRQFKMISALNLRVDSGNLVAGETGPDHENTKLLATPWEAAAHGPHTRYHGRQRLQVQPTTLGSYSKGRERGTLASSRATSRPCRARPTATSTAEAAASRKDGGQPQVTLRTKTAGMLPLTRHPALHYCGLRKSARSGSGRRAFSTGSEMVCSTAGGSVRR
jgi:hypothetical protein